jgi:hypothetical protein
MAYIGQILTKTYLLKVFMKADSGRKTERWEKINSECSAARKALAE